MLQPPLQVLVSIALAGVMAQGVKIALIIFSRHERFHPADLVVTGGMPSSHSALVTSLALSIFLSEGLTIPFLISAAFAAVVLRDALGVRRTAGEEGQLINQIIRKTKLRLPELHYSLGHTPSQVAVGVLIGISSALLASFL